MKVLESSLPTRRDAMTMIAASAAVLVAPMRALAQPKSPIVVTMTRFPGAVSDQLTKTITERRRNQGFLSQKILKNSERVVLIEEWRRPMALGGDTYSRKEV